MMYLVEDVLVSEELFTRCFVCQLSACKGACCWEGDFGAPLMETEVEQLNSCREVLRAVLSSEGNETLDSVGSSVHYPELERQGTPLVAGGPCAYLLRDQLTGIATCGIQQAYERGQINIQKPISCHLYPVRFLYHEPSGMKALNYESWSICGDACTLGSQLAIPVFRFVKDALVRQFSQGFYDQLEAIYADQFNSGALEL